MHQSMSKLTPELNYLSKLKSTHCNLKICISNIPTTSGKKIIYKFKKFVYIARNSQQHIELVGRQMRN